MRTKKRGLHAGRLRGSYLVKNNNVHRVWIMNSLLRLRARRGRNVCRAIFHSDLKNVSRSFCFFFVSILHEIFHSID